MDSVQYATKVGINNANAPKLLIGTVLQGSNDGTNWIDIYTIGNEIFSG